MKAPQDIQKYEGHYSQEKLSAKLLKYAKKMGIKLVYWTLVLSHAAFGKGVSAKDRGIILGALGYLILPVDLLPDFLPVVGFTDDIAAILFAVTKVGKNITPAVRAQADAEVRNLFGQFDRRDVDFVYDDYDSSIDEQ